MAEPLACRARVRSLAGWCTYAAVEAVRGREAVLSRAGGDELADDGDAGAANTDVDLDEGPCVDWRCVSKRLRAFGVDLDAVEADTARERREAAAEEGGDDADFVWEGVGNFPDRRDREGEHDDVGDYGKDIRCLKVLVSCLS